MSKNPDFKTSIQIFTDGSTNPNPGPSGWGFYALAVDENGVETSHHGYGPIGPNGTNNIAELTAIIKGLQYLLTLPMFEEIMILSDSTYAINGLPMVDRWARYDWITSSGTPVKNIELWKQLKSLVDECKTQNRHVVFTWLRGHSGIDGNELADANADKGRRLVGESTEDVIVANTTTPIPPVVTAEEKVKASGPKITLNPLLAGKRWFFHTNGKEILDDGRRFYLQSTYKDDDKIKHKNNGKRNADTSYAILLTEQPIPQLDSLREKYNRVNQIAIAPVVAELALFTKPKIWSYINESNHQLTEIKGGMAVAPDSTVIAETINPPLLVYKLESIYHYGFKLIERFEQQDPTLVTMDITELCVMSVKKKFNLKPELSPGVKLVTVAGVQLSETLKSDIKLTIGTDFIPRNNLSALVKAATTPPAITLLVFDITPTSYRVASIVQHEGHTAVYYSPDSNYRLVSQVKKK